VDIELQVQQVYERANLGDEQIRSLERIRASAPARKVGASALLNTVTRLSSRLMGRHVVVESRTCEALRVLTLELLEDDIVAIYPQPLMERVERFSARGTRSVGPVTCDLLIYWKNRIELCECKPLSRLAKESQANPHEWIVADGSYRRPSCERWALARGCKYTIWSPPEPSGIYWANLEHLHPLTHSPYPEKKALSNAIVRSVQNRPTPLSQLIDAYGNQASQHVCNMLANRMLFANLRSGLIDEPYSLYISTDKQRISELDDEALRRIRSSLAPLDIDDPILTATKTDVSHGRERLARVHRIIAGEEAATARMRRLVSQVIRAADEGQSQLAVCLTSYATSGTSNRRVSPEQLGAMEFAIRKHWNTIGGETTLKGLHLRLKTVCSDRGIDDVPSITTLRREVKKDPSAAHDSAVGGSRQFHAKRPQSDPAVRSVRSMAPFQMMHIDSTKFDHRSGTELPELPFSCPVLYCAIDAATGEVLGRSLTFGAPSRFGLCLLLRDIVKRHGRVPFWWMADRGSEMWSELIVSLAEVLGVQMMMRPSGAGPFGAEIEAALKSINCSIAHRLVGSTLPDQAGRSVDGRFKSYKTARLLFRFVVEVLDYYLFELWPDKPVGEIKGTPREIRGEKETQFGNYGRAVVLDDAFILRTSVPIDREVRITKSNIIQWMYRDYTSDELTRAIREHGRPEEFRADCADPSLGYAKFGGQWIRVRTSTVLREQVRDETDRIFAQIYTRDAARISRALHKEHSRKAFDAVDLANASAPANAGVLPGAEPAATQPAQLVSPSGSPWDSVIANAQPLELMK